jgi:very-short-patch-repair endonuclease
MKSPAETLLAVQLEQAGIPFEREYRFHETRRWRFDFAWPSIRLAAEIEGGSWTSGRHNRGAGFEADLIKYNAAAEAGWYVLRFTTEMVNDGRALDHCIRAYQVHRIWSRTDRTSGCWYFEGAVPEDGYGRVRHAGKTALAHRIIWRFVHGEEIPDGLDIDHTCHNADEACAGGKGCPHRRCVNPAHLEAVTRSVNVSRGRMGNRGARRECKQGHGPLEKLAGQWGCRTCKNERNRAYRRRILSMKEAA